MKKLLLLVTGLATLFNLASCSSNNEDDETKGNNVKKYLAEITIKEHSYKFGERESYGKLYEQYKYDNNGNLMEKTITHYRNYSKAGENEDIFQYIYNEKNMLVEEVKTSLFGDKNITKYYYNDFDSVSVAKIYLGNGSLVETHTYEYDNNHKLIKKTVFNHRVQIENYGLVHSYSYSDNTITEVTTKLLDGSPMYTYIYEYDTHENLISEKYRASDGYKSTEEYQYEYDSNGRVIKCISPYYSDKMYREYTYNEDGTINIIHISFSYKNDQIDLIYTYTWK